MKALRFHKFGPPSVLAIDEIAQPEPQEGEALVKIKAAAINPSDVKNVAGLFPATALPRTPGRDFAGIIATGRRKGEAVWSSGPGMGMAREGAQAEYAVVPEEALAPMPKNLSMEQAAALGVPFLAAWAALMQATQVLPGETVLLVGAGGAVGQAAAQIARWKGARVLGADRSDAIAHTDAAINTQKEDMRQRVLELTSGTGADLVFDMVGGAMFEPALRSLRHGGRQVAITSTGEQRVSFNLVDFYRNESRLLGVEISHFGPREVAEIAAALTPGLESGALKPPPTEAVPFAQATAAYEKIAAGQAQAKQVLTF